MGTIAPGVLLGNQSILPPKEDFRGTITTQLGAEWAAYNDVVAREDIHTCGDIALATLAPHDELRGEWSLKLAEMCAHGGIVGRRIVCATALVVDGNWNARACGLDKTGRTEVTASLFQSAFFYEWRRNVRRATPIRPRMPVPSNTNEVGSGV
jgi:hypothetical protein